MTACTEGGVDAMGRVLRIIGSTVGLVPQHVIEATDWDSMATRAPIVSTSATEDEVAALGFNWAKRETTIEEAMDRAGIPTRYRATPPALNHVEELERGSSLYIVGRQGSGKTYAACATMRAWLSRNRGDALFVTSVGLLTEIGATYSTSDTALGVIERYGRCDLLCIDDLGKEVPTPHALEMLWCVLDMRYSWELPTIVTSQFSIGELATRLASRGDVETSGAIASRLAETCVRLTMGNVDRRLGMTS